MLVQQRQREPGAVAEAAVQRPGADARGAGDVVHRDVLDAALVHQLRRRRQDAQPVAGGVRPLVRRLAVIELRELEHGVHHAAFHQTDCSTGDPTSRSRSPSTIAEAVAELGVGERAVELEGGVRQADRQLGVERMRTRRLERLADLRLRPDGAEQAGARPDDRGRLLAQHVVGERARGPVERVLEPAGDRRVVLRGGDQERRRPPRPRSGTPPPRAAGSPRGPHRRWAGPRGPPTPRTRLRAGASRPPPGAAAGCGSPGARCPRCRGSASLTPARRARARRSG